MYNIMTVHTLYAHAVQSLDGAVTGSWEGIRVNSLATHPHQDLVYAADTHHRIRQYNFQDHSSSTVLVHNNIVESYKDLQWSLSAIDTPWYSLKKASLLALYLGPFHVFQTLKNHDKVWLRG